MGIFSRLLAHPLTRNLSVDDPCTTLFRRDIIEDKAFLRKIYCEWYAEILFKLKKKDCVLELGSGAGFLQNLLPELIKSEIFYTPGIQLVADACMLPLSDNSLDAIVMTDVFHHIPDVNRFLSEAARCIRPQGQIIMIEPWHTTWSKWVYRSLHSEPYDPESAWEIPSSGPLSGANGALPWIVFKRDREILEKLHPQWQLNTIKPMMPFAYLLSGGISMRSLIPGALYKVIRSLESNLNQNRWAMFALIELQLNK